MNQPNFPTQMGAASMALPKSQVTLRDTHAVECDECKNTTFREVVMMRRVSRLLTGAPKDSYMPIPSFECASCGHVNDEFLPAELKPEPSKLVVK